MNIIGMLMLLGAGIYATVQMLRDAPAFKVDYFVLILYVIVGVMLTLQ